MDNPPPLTPNKIQRLMYLAEDKSFNTYKSGTYDVGLSSAPKGQTRRSSAAYDSSSGLLDLDKYEGFGESQAGSLSLSKSTTFHPGEMTGRSTGAEDISKIFFGPPPTFNEFGRHSVSDLHDYEKKFIQQSNDVQELMRQSIASGYSYHSRRDLTADEASLVLREAPLPVPQSQIDLHLKDCMPETDPVELSMGAYFKNRCQQFDDLLPRTDSPQYDVSSMALSMAEDSLNLNQTKEIPKKESNNLFQMDMTLDCVPVRQPRVAQLSEKTADINTFVPISPAKENKQLMGPPASTNRPYVARQATFLLDPSRHHLSTSQRPVHEDSCKSEDYDSLSLSKIANILEKESDISVATMINHMKGQRGNKHPNKHPLTEINMNLQENRAHQQEVQVVHLKDTRKSVTASSAGTVNTVIDMGKLKINQENEHKEVPCVVVTQPKEQRTGLEVDSDVKTENRTTRSKSPSSKSRSTMSTVQENFGCVSFKSGDSPMQPSKGEKPTHVLSPNIEYKELDKSVDWDEVMQMKGRLHSQGLTKEPWAEIQTRPIKGFVGVSTPATVTIKSLSDSWLTARLAFPRQKDITIDLPRFPLLLAPKSCEHCTVQVTSNVETMSNLNFILYLKDSSVDGDAEIEGAIVVDVQMPTIQAIAADGVNKVSFPPIQEGKFLTRSLILISDCSVDLQLELSVKEGGSMFTIYSVQEIKKSDMTKELLDQVMDGKLKYRSKGLSKQLCRLSSGNALKVSLTFSTPKMVDLNLDDTVATFNGCLDVNLIGINAVLKKIDLVASVGRPRLIVNILGKQSQTGKLHLTNDVTNLMLANAGSIGGTWLVKFKGASAISDQHYPFKVSTNQLEIGAGQSINLKVAFTGPEDSLTEDTLTFQEILSGAETSLELTGGRDKPTPFPVKTSCSELSWVRPGRKELSLKNITDKKLYIKCRIKGEGFYIDCANSGVNSNMHVTMNANECRPLPVVFRPSTNQPCKGSLYMAYEKETEISRKVSLYGCSSGEALRWSGLVTYGDTALVRALARQPIHLHLGNKSPAPVFIAARVHFNLQYVSVAATSRLEGARRVVPGKGATTVTLHVDWARAERRARAAAHCAATALATVTVLTGAEFTRRRILKVLKQGSTGELDVSSLPAHLQPLAGRFEAEDPHMDELLKEFDEAKTSLDELVGGIHELTAQIDLPQDFSDDTTILITDDTVVDHHTLCE